MWRLLFAVSLLVAVWFHLQMYCIHCEGRCVWRGWNLIKIFFGIINVELWKCENCSEISFLLLLHSFFIDCQSQRGLLRLEHKWTNSQIVHMSYSTQLFDDFNQKIIIYDYNVQMNMVLLTKKEIITQFFRAQKQKFNLFLIVPGTDAQGQRFLNICSYIHWTEIHKM